MAEKHSQEYIICLLDEKDLELVYPYVNKRTPLHIRCKKCGFYDFSRWRPKLQDVKNHGHCPVCSALPRKLKYTEEEVRKILLEKNIELISLYFKGKIRIIEGKCLICNFFDPIRWHSTFSDIVNSGYGCPKCSGILKYTINEVRQILLEKNIKLWSTIYENNKQKLDVECLSCGFRDIKRWNPSFHNLSKHGCPRCAGLLQLTVDEIREQLLKRNIKLLEIQPNVKINSKQKLPVECLRCGFSDLNSWYPSYNAIMRQKYSCPVCSQKYKQETNLKKYGVRFSSQNSQIRQKVRETNLFRFGFDTPCKNPEIAAKAARNNAQITYKFHWKTNDKILCQGTYEIAIVDWLNETKQEYRWQRIHFSPFQMPNSKTYIPDLYLPVQNLWIEIKGYFRKDAQEKWNWFHKEYPNSELWGQEKLKELGVWKRIQKLQQEKRKIREQQQSEVI